MSGSPAACTRHIRVEANLDARKIGTTTGRAHDSAAGHKIGVADQERCIPGQLISGRGAGWRGRSGHGGSATRADELRATLTRRGGTGWGAARVASSSGESFPQPYRYSMRGISSPASGEGGSSSRQVSSPDSVCLTTSPLQNLRKRSGNPVRKSCRGGLWIRGHPSESIVRPSGIGAVTG